MAKKTKKTKVRTAVDIAGELAIVRGRMAEDKVLDRALTLEFKAALAAEGMQEAGNYSLEKVMSFKVAVEELALPFALQRNLVKIDVAKVRDVFRRDADLRFKDPTQYGFEVVDSEKIAPKGRGKVEEEE